jgi:hypothetical protein
MIPSGETEWHHLLKSMGELRPFSMQASLHSVRRAAVLITMRSLKGCAYPSHLARFNKVFPLPAPIVAAPRSAALISL